MEQVTLLGEEKACGRCPPTPAGRANFLRCCLQLALGPRKMATLPTEALWLGELAPTCANHLVFSAFFSVFSGRHLFQNPDFFPICFVVLKGDDWMMTAATGIASD